jgi:hypothetical protein
MPRLIGKRSNTSANTTLLIIATLGILTGLEYLGVINVINNFGNDRIEISAYKDRN